MKKIVVILAAAAAIAAHPRAAAAQEIAPQPYTEPPPRGVGLIVTGSVFTGIGAVNLLTSPICKTSLIGSSDTQNVCLGVSLGIGITFVVIGIPMLAVGVHQRNAYREWKRTNGMARLLDLDVKPLPGGGALTWRGTF